MYAYSTTDGKALWQFDTAREFETVNGVAAKGGNINAAGPVVAGGMVFVPSATRTLVRACAATCCWRLACREGKSARKTEG